MNYVTNWEKSAEVLIRERRWHEALTHIASIKRHKRYMKNPQIAEKIYLEILKDESSPYRTQALQGLASLYYTEYIFAKGGDTAVHRSGAAKKAIQYFNELLMIERKPQSVYQYAHILYRNARESVGKEDFLSLCLQKEKAYTLYDEAVEALKDDRYAENQALYARSCYGLCRCGLESLTLLSILLEEISLLFPISIPLYGDLPVHIKRVQRMYHCLESLLQLEQLPQRTDNILSIAQAKQKYENSWNIYYLLGKLFDSALRFSLSRSPEKSYILAERYYLYACEIDLARRQTGKSVSGFTHMYTALLTLYLRNRKETDFYAAWKRYHSFVTIPESFKTLSQIRWLIIKGAFAEAQVKLREYGRLAERKTQQKQVTALLDIIEVICSGNTKNLRGIYRPFHLRQLEKVRRLTEKKIRKHA